MIFLKPNAKVEAKYYQQILRQHFPAIRRLSGQRQFTLQQDGARSHTTHSTIDFIERSVPDYIEKENWPANSCDLNPLDYALGIMEQAVYGNHKRYQNLEDLKAAIRRAWQQLSHRLINKSIDQWRDRLQKVVAANGGHIEHLFD